MDVRGVAKLWLPFATVAACLIAAREYVVCVHGHEQPTETWMTPDESRMDPDQRPPRFVSGDVLFETTGCPYLIMEDQAKMNKNDKSMAGSMIELTSHNGGRSGNHFMMLSSYLAMGFCCKAKLLTFPGKDKTLPTDGDMELKAEHRWYDFSKAEMPWDEYKDMHKNPDICRPHRADGGGKAFNYDDVHWKLLKCMNQVYLRGCEAAYLGEVVDTDRICPRIHKEKEEASKGQERNGAGSLVVHIRSGDIFDPQGEGSKRHGFGQPSLQFFLMAIASRPWDDVSIITAAWEDRTLNPTYSALALMAQAGTLGPNVRLLRNRPLAADVEEMLCADGLATARSSLSLMTFAHTTATSFFIPSECGDGKFRRMRDPPVKATWDNTTLLALEKPYAQIYGIKWAKGGYKSYSVFQEWKDSPGQLLEMVTNDGIARLKRC